MYESGSGSGSGCTGRAAAVNTTNPIIPVTAIKFRPASAADRESGILCYASCVVHGQLRLDDLAVRRRRAGGLPYVQYPSRRTARGHRRYAVAPISAVVRREIETAILLELPDWVFGERGRP